MRELDFNRVRVWTPLIVLAVTPLLGAVCGGLMNAFNGWVCPDYFVTVLGWTSTTIDIWREAIGQGMWEGAVIASLFGLVLSITIVASTRLRCPVSLAFSFIAKSIGAVVVLCIVGGLVGIVQSKRNPDSWTGVVGYPATMSDWTFWWVEGTVRGAYAGAFVGTALCSVYLHFRWKRLARYRVVGFSVLPVTPMPQGSVSDHSAGIRGG